MAEYFLQFLGLCFCIDLLYGVYTYLKEKKNKEKKINLIFTSNFSNILVSFNLSLWLVVFVQFFGLFAAIRLTNPIDSRRTEENVNEMILIYSK